MEVDPQPQAAPEVAAAPESTPAHLTAGERLARVFDYLPENEMVVSNGQQPASPDDDEDDDEDDESAGQAKPAAGVKSPAEGDNKDAPKPTDEKPLSRRQQREADRQKATEEAVRVAREEARAEALAEIERDRIAAEREQAEAPTRQQQEAAERQRAEDAERFERLSRTPVSQMTGDDYDWLEDQKALLVLYPDAVAQAEALAERKLTERQQALDTEHQTAVQAFWGNVRADMAQAKDLPGVDVEALKKAPSFAEQYRLLHAAGAASRDAEVAKHVERITELEEQIADLRLVGPRGLGASRAPVGGGRANDNHDSRRFDERRSPRENLASALGF